MIAKVLSLSHRIRSTFLQAFDEINENCVLGKKKKKPSKWLIQKHINLKATNNGFFL
jgi:hypothetical protein